MNPALRFISSQHWAIIPGVLDSLLSLIEQHDAGHRATAAEIKAAQAARPAADLGDDGDGSESEMSVAGGTAVIPIRGVLARYSDQINGACQSQGRSAESIQADIAKAVADPTVSRIILRIDSPGGAVAGTAETGDAVRAASAAGKKVTAFVDGLCASAALWIAAQADEIVAASPAALIGSIGVMMTVVDSSKSQEAKGGKVHVIRSVDLKAPGAGGSQVSPEQLKSVQKLVANLHGLFVGAVASGRGMDADQMAAAATGEVFTAQAAVAMGLVDRIASWESVASGVAPGRTARHSISSSITAVTPAPTPTKGNTMKPEDLKSLKAKHPDHAGLIVDMFADGKTEAETLAAIEGVQRTQLSAKVDALIGKIDKQVVDHKAALTAKDDQIAKLQADLDKANKVAALGNGSPAPVGGLEGGTDGLTSLEKQWAGDADLRKKFGDDKEGFLALSALESEQSAIASGRGKSTFTPINPKNITKDEGAK